MLIIGMVLVILITAGLTYYIAKSGANAVPQANDTNASLQGPTITVRGEASKSYDADLLTIGISIESLSGNASASQSKSAQDTALVKAALLSSGLNQSDIETGSYYTYPVYNESCYDDCYPYYGEAVQEDIMVYEGSNGAARCIGPEGETMVGPMGEMLRCGSGVSAGEGVTSEAMMDIAPSPPYPYHCKRSCEIIGYKTTHLLVIETGDTQAGGKLVDAALNATNTTQISYIYFSLKEETRLRAESDLQADAASAAKQKAENIAKGLGATLGKIVSINPDHYYPYPMYAYDRAESYGGTATSPASLPTEIFPSDTTMYSSITVVYEIVQ